MASPDLRIAEKAMTCTTTGYEFRESSSVSGRALIGVSGRSDAAIR
jgi:hypothetical protein